MIRGLREDKMSNKTTGKTDVYLENVNSYKDELTDLKTKNMDKIDRKISEIDKKLDANVGSTSSKLKEFNKNIKNLSERLEELISGTAVSMGVIENIFKEEDEGTAGAMSSRK